MANGCRSLPNLMRFLREMSESPSNPSFQRLLEIGLGLTRRSADCCARATRKQVLVEGTRCIVAKRQNVLHWKPSTEWVQPGSCPYRDKQPSQCRGRVQAVPLRFQPIEAKLPVNCVRLIQHSAYQS